MFRMAHEVSPNLIVLRGVFAGMVYPQALACGSALTPKLLGCYESELTDVIERICVLPVADMYDIGCAEGYYAVGFAMRMHTARIHAFDTDEVARDACRALAAANDVVERVFVGGGVGREDVLSWKNGSMILSDCEGFESVLFDAEVADRHNRSWFLIEVHDTVDPDLSIRLRSVFEKTHEVISITSLDDLKKTDYYVIPELEGKSRAERLRYVSENRPRLMDWFWCCPKLS